MPQPLYYQAETFVWITWTDGPDYDMDAGLEEPAVHIALQYIVSLCRDHTARD